LIGDISPCGPYSLAWDVRRWQALQQKRVASVATGAVSSAALMQSGEVYTWVHCHKASVSIISHAHIARTHFPRRVATRITS
jgi:hypothetical protein